MTGINTAKNAIFIVTRKHAHAYLCIFLVTKNIAFFLPVILVDKEGYTTFEITPGYLF